MNENTFYQLLIISLIIISFYFALTREKDIDSYTFTNNMPVNITVGDITIYNENKTCDCSYKNPWYFPYQYVEKVE